MRKVDMLVADELLRISISRVCLSLDELSGPESNTGTCALETEGMESVVLVEPSMLKETSATMPRVVLPYTDMDDPERTYDVK